MLSMVWEWIQNLLHGHLWRWLLVAVAILWAQPGKNAEPFLTCHARLQWFAATEGLLLDHCGRRWGWRCSPRKAPTRSWWATMSYPHSRGWGPEGEGAKFFEWWRLLLAATCILQDVTICKAAGRYHFSSLDKNGTWWHCPARWPQTGRGPNWWELATCPHG